VSPRFVISGTDTGIGKTVFAAALTHALKAHYWKPVQSGLEEETDSETVARLAGVPHTHILPEAYRLKTPASPHLAARAEGVTIRHERIAAARLRLAAASDLLLAEGAGGWLAPISATETMADVAEKLALPVILVVGLRLGCLNHALLTRDAIRARGMRFAGWIANKMAVEMPLAAANIETLTSRFGVAPMAVVPVGSTMGFHPTPEAPPSWASEAAEKLVSL